MIIFDDFVNIQIETLNVHFVPYVHFVFLQSAQMFGMCHSTCKFRKKSFFLAHIWRIYAIIELF